jgi:hypothetical protein
MAGSIANLQVTMNAIFSWQASVVNYILGTQTTQSQLGLQEIFGTAVGLPFPANQCIIYNPTIAASGSTTIDLVTPAANIVGNTAATLARIFGAILWVPSVDQNVNLGCTSSGITWGNAASDPVALFGIQSTGTAILNSGEFMSWMTPSATGLVPVAAVNCNFLIANNDATSGHTAKPILALIGNDV